MDISQESDLKSQDEIPVRPSFGKNFECYLRERYLKKISVVGVYRAAILSEKFSCWECFSPIEVSNLRCYLVFTQISSLRPWKVWIRTARLFLVSLRQFKKRNRRQNCCGQGEKFACSEWMILFWIIAESVRRNHPVGKYSNSGNC